MRQTSCKRADKRENWGMAEAIAHAEDFTQYQATPGFSFSLTLSLLVFIECALITKLRASATTRQMLPFRRHPQAGHIVPFPDEGKVNVRAQLAA